jgi:hypothetical protein
MSSGALPASRRPTPAVEATASSGSSSGMRKSVAAPVELDDLGVSKKTLPPAEQTEVDDKQQEEIDSHIQKKVTEAVVYLVFLIVFLIWSIRYYDSHVTIFCCWVHHLSFLYVACCSMSQCLWRSKFILCH